MYFRKKRDCTICVAKTKALISFAVTARLICVFVFAYAKIGFSHDAAQIQKLQKEQETSLVLYEFSDVGFICSDLYVRNFGKND